MRPGADGSKRRNANYAASTAWLTETVFEPSGTPKIWFKKLGFGTGVWTLWYAAAPDCKEESNPHEHRPKA